MKKAILPILLIIYIIGDMVLKQQGVELCSSTGCEMAGELLKFDSRYLNYLGALGALTLAFLAFLKLDKLFTWLAATMVIFESLLIASQINLNPEVCKFCLGVYALLWLILLTANRKVALYATAPALAVFAAFTILSIPQNRSLISSDGLYLISSKTCPHCKKTKEFLDSKNIEYKTIKSSDLNAFYFAKSLNIKQIPIAIIAKGKEYKIVVGDRDIIEHFNTKSQAQSNQTSTQASPVEQYKPKLNLSGNDDGCSFSVIKESDCDAQEPTK